MSACWYSNTMVGGCFDGLLFSMFPKKITEEEKVMIKEDYTGLLAMKKSHPVITIVMVGLLCIEELASIVFLLVGIYYTDPVMISVSVLCYWIISFGWNYLTGRVQKFFKMIMKRRK